MKTKLFIAAKAVLFFSLSALFLSGCKTPVTPEPEKDVPSISAAFDSIGITSANLVLTSNKLTKYAYIITDDLTAAAQAPVMIFANGVSGDLTDGKNTVKVSSLSGNTA